MTMSRATLLISGRVQGVAFRHYTSQFAQSQGVNGWVRNLPSGEVEALLEGEAEAVNRVIAWCQHGPPTAQVTGVKIAWGSFSGEFADFVVRR